LAAEVPQREEMEIEPFNTDENQAEGIAGFASRGMALQTVMRRYKRESGESASAMMTCGR
jgi:hypothetical protein